MLTVWALQPLMTFSHLGCSYACGIELWGHLFCSAHTVILIHRFIWSVPSRQHWAKRFCCWFADRHRSVWPTEDQFEHGRSNKLGIYHNWVALPYRHNSYCGKPLHVPRYLYIWTRVGICRGALLVLDYTLTNYELQRLGHAHSLPHKHTTPLHTKPLDIPEALASAVQDSSADGSPSKCTRSAMKNTPIFMSHLNQDGQNNKKT